MNGDRYFANYRHSVWAGLAIVVVMSLIAPEAHAARVVAEKRECATCHIAWIADFKRDDVKTLIPYEPRPVVETGRQDVVSTERMCFSCHDGFVLDSRFLWLNEKHTHPVGVAPSDKVRIPEEEGKTIFPLNDDGKVYCGTCHSAHGVEWGDKVSPVFLRARNIDSSLCMTCHVDRTEEHDGKLNHPLKRKLPEQAKKLRGSGSKFSRKGEVICQSCHRVHGAKGDKLLVVNNDRSQLCASCHGEKSAIRTKRETGPFTHPVGVVPKEATVPAKFAESGSRFGPDNEVVCQTCHEVHLAPTDKLLVLGEKSLKDGICVLCHKDKRSIVTSGHNLLRKDVKGPSDREHRPSRNLGVCGVCHNVHDGQGPKMWARKLAPAQDHIAPLCLSCHTQGAPAEQHTVGEYSHPVGVTLPASAKAGGLPLFTLSGEKTFSRRSGLVSCPTCHDVHGPASRLDGKSEVKTKSRGVGKYLRKGEGDLVKLCKTCHEDKWSITATKHDLHKGKLTSEPLGICGECHRVHNGKGPRMWSRDGKLNETDLGTLCLNCHSRGGPAEKKVTGEHSHPIGVPVEKAGIKVTRRGWIAQVGDKEIRSPSRLPLYDRRGKKRAGGGGRVACATCHDPHKWSSSHSATARDERNPDDGDASNSFLRIPAAPDGELCITCHRAKATVRATDHDLAVTAPDASNALHEGPAQSGVCGQCHAVHNAVETFALWGRLPGQAGNAPEELCRSCHAKGEIAQAKVPAKASHPNYVMAWDGALRDPDKSGITHLPVFSDNGARSAIGYITCPTCHDVHQWRPNRPEKGSGENEEGDVFSSFLRMGSTEGMLCADCHGPDSIFRYKYFHGVDFTKRRDD